MSKLPTHSARLPMEIDEVEREMTYVYLSDFIAEFSSDEDVDFWLANCSDGYQSNFTPAIIEATNPYLILTVEGQPLGAWLAEIGHPEWGPFIINTEKTDSLRDPGHKNPWGVEEIIATKLDLALSGLPEAFSNPAHSLGQDIYLNACLSCHSTESDLMGGHVSTRNLSILSLFASNSEEYFENMLIDPSATNPLATKMPSYAHYSDEEKESLKRLLTAVAGK